MNKILVPIDFSSITAEILKIAVEQAKFSHGKIFLLHVENPEPGFVGYEPGLHTPEQSSHLIRSKVATHSGAK